MSTSVVAVSLSVLVTGYHFVLGLVAIVCRRSADSTAGCVTRFVILIPAHNEEAVLSRVIASCRAQDYPSENFEIIVIADNCNDGTAAAANEAGAICWERVNPTQRGKGNALAWGIERAVERGVDAIVVIDADCTLDRNGLRLLNEHVLAGHRAVQLNNFPDNPDASAATYLLAVANKLENDFFYLPKDMLGMAVFLRGTGMMLSQDLLKACPWRARSRAEDAEYSVRVLRHGYRIYFEPHAAVRSAAPTLHSQLATQRNRWIGGQLDVAARAFLGLLGAAIRNRDLRLIDAAWTGFITLRIVTLSVLIGAAALTGMAALFVDDPRFDWLFTAAILSMALFGVYVFVGVIALGMTRSRLGLLVAAVPESARYLMLSMRACFNRDKAWKRTER